MAGGGQVVGTISIKVTPDTKTFRRELKAEVEAIEKEIKGRIEFKADFDANGLKGKVDAAAKAAKAKVPVEADVKSLDLFQKRMLAELAKAHQGLDAKLPLDVDGEKLRRKLAAEVFFIEHSIKAKIPIELHLAAGQRAKIAAEIGALSALAAGEKAGISVLEDMGQTFAQLGSNALGAVGNVRAFGIGLAGLVAITSLVAPGIALLSGLLVALPGIAAGVVAPIAAIALGFKGIEAALEHSGLMVDQLDKKGKPTGKKGVGPELAALMKPVGDVFDKGLTPVFKQLETQLFPALEKSVPVVAQGLVGVAQAFTNVITSGPGLASINNIFTNIGESINRSAPGIANFTQGILTLADKLTAKFPGLADSFTKIGEQFLGWVDKITTADPKTGISQFDTAMHNLKGTLSEISGLIGDIFKWGWDNLGGADFGSKIKDFAKDLRGLIVETLPALNKSMEGMGKAIKPIADMLNGLNKAGAVVGKLLGTFNPHGEDKKPFLQQDLGQQLLGGLGHNFENQLKEWLNPGSTQQIISDALVPGAAAAGQEAGAAAGKGLSDGVKGLLTGGVLGGGKPLATDLLSSLTAGQDPKATKDQILANLPSPEELANRFSGVAGQIQTTLASIGPQVQAAFDMIQPQIDGIKNTLTTAFDGIGPAISQAASAAIPQIVGVFSGITPLVAAQFAGLGPAVGAQMQAVVQQIQAAGTQGEAEIKSWAGKFQAAAGDMQAVGTSIGVALGVGVAGGIASSTGAAVAAAQTMAGAVAAAARGALGINSPSKVFHDIGSYSATGFQEGLEGGFQGVIERAKALATQLADAMKSGVVQPELKNELKQELAELGLQYDQLKVQRDALNPGDKDGRKSLSEQMKQVSTIKDQLRLQSDQLGFTDKYGKDQNDITQQLGQQLSKMIDIGKGFGMANIQQFEQDLGISGNGAIPTIANSLLDWGSGMLGQMISGAFGGGQGGGVQIHVNSVDDALAARQNIVNKQALGIAGR